MSNGGPRHEFRFVVAGIELSKEHQEHLANAVANAGALALAELDLTGPEQPVAGFIPREWLGRWLQILEPGLGRELETKLGIDKQLNR
jgi:hypothetical protein